MLQFTKAFLLLAFFGLFPAASEAGIVDFFFPATVTASGETPAVCNCTEMPASAELCHSATSDVTIGVVNVGTFKTGHSATECVTIPLFPCKCVYIRYNYHCQTGLFGMTCVTVSSAIKSRVVMLEDCGDGPPCFPDEATDFMTPDHPK